MFGCRKACFCRTQMHSFVSIKCMQLYVTNAGIRVKGRRWGGRSLRSAYVAFCDCTVNSCIVGHEDKSRRKSFPIFRLNIGISGKFPFIDTVILLINKYD